MVEFIGKNMKEKKRKVEELEESTVVMETEMNEDKKEWKRMKVTESTGDIVEFHQGEDGRVDVCDGEWEETMRDLIHAFDRLEIKEKQQVENEGCSDERLHVSSTRGEDDEYGGDEEDEDDDDDEEYEQDDDEDDDDDDGQYEEDVDDDV